MAGRKKATEKSAPEPVSAEMLQQLMGQLQSLATEVSELRKQVAEPAESMVTELEYDRIDPEDRVTEEEAAALLEAFDMAISEAENLIESHVADVVPEPEAELAPVPAVEVSPISDEEIAEAIDSMEPEAQIVAEVDPEDGGPEPDEEAKSVADPVADESAPAAPEEEFFGELIELDEDVLAQLVRQSIEQQAQVLDAEPDVPPQAENLVSADDLVQLLEEPDPVMDGVPAQSTAMSEEELADLLREAQNLEVKPADSGSQNPVAEPQKEAEPIHPAAAIKQQQENDVDLGAIRAIPAHLAIRAMALPVGFEGGKVVCRVAEPIDRTALDRLSKEVGLGIVPKPAPIAEVVAGLRQAYSEVSDFQARHALIQGSQKSPRGIGKLFQIWKKGA